MLSIHQFKNKQTTKKTTQLLNQDKLKVKRQSRGKKKQQKTKTNTILWKSFRVKNRCISGVSVWFLKGIKILTLREKGSRPTGRARDGGSRPSTGKFSSALPAVRCPADTARGHTQVPAAGRGSPGRV